MVNRRTGQPESRASGEALYPMRVVARMTGLSAHAIRIWERRYGAVRPRRTGGNSRRYSAAEVRRLTLLRQATLLGHGIRDLAALSDERLTQLVERAAAVSDHAPDLGRGPSPYAQLRAEYLAAVERFDATGAAELLGRASLAGRDAFLLQVALPILRETGDRWHAGTFTVAQEHLVTAQVRGLLEGWLRLAAPPPGAPAVLIATPSGQRHELGALAAAVLAASRGLEAIYLGPDVPATDLERALERGSARVVVLALLRDCTPAELRQLDELLAALQRRAAVWVGLPAAHAALDRVRGVRYFTRFEDLELAYSQLVAGTRAAS